MAAGDGRRNCHPWCSIFEVEKEDGGRKTEDGGRRTEAEEEEGRLILQLRGRGGDRRPEGDPRRRGRAARGPPPGQGGGGEAAPG